jgi:isopenicillin N synthase-like dioxygenase
MLHYPLPIVPRDSNRNMNLTTVRKWISASPNPGTSTVNSGGMLSYWRNDLFVSNVHRAMKVTGEES